MTTKAICLSPHDGTRYDLLQTGQGEVRIQHNTIAVATARRMTAVWLHLIP